MRLSSSANCNKAMTHYHCSPPAVTHQYDTFVQPRQQLAPTFGEVVRQSCPLLVGVICGVASGVDSFDYSFNCDTCRQLAVIIVHPKRSIPHIAGGTHAG